MAHYYLDLDECGDLTEDEEGIDVENLAVARTSAITAARDVMMGEVARGKLCLGCAILIRDTAGARVMTVPFIDALAVTFGK